MNTQSDTIDSDVSKLLYLLQAGFINVGSIADIKMNGFSDLSELTSCGLYAITKPSTYQKEFFTLEEVLKNKNVLSPWSIDKLEQKWVEDSDILYFGVAGTISPRPLKKRLTDLINHCCGRTSDRGPHKGGEIIWQLKNYDCFEIWILPVNFSASPRLIEENLLRSYFAQKRKLPFANRKF